MASIPRPLGGIPRLVRCQKVGQWLFKTGFPFNNLMKNFIGKGVEWSFLFYFRRYQFSPTQLFFQQIFKKKPLSFLDFGSCTISGTDPQGENDGNFPSNYKFSRINFKFRKANALTFLLLSFFLQCIFPGEIRYGGFQELKPPEPPKTIQCYSALKTLYFDIHN